MVSLELSKIIKGAEMKIIIIFFLVLLAPNTALGEVEAGPSPKLAADMIQSICAGIYSNSRNDYLVCFGMQSEAFFRMYARSKLVLDNFASARTGKSEDPDYIKAFAVARILADNFHKIRDECFKKNRLNLIGVDYCEAEWINPLLIPYIKPS